MELIDNNPYRIAGILSNATARELQRQKTKVTAYSKVGKEIKSEYDFKFLKYISRTEESIHKAFSNIEQNADKVNYALFWFIGDVGLNHLVADNEEKAVEIWEKITNNKEVNSVNFSAFNNLGTYKLLSQSENQIQEGIEYKIKLLESDFFENFAQSVADETFRIETGKQIEKFVDELLTQFKNQYSNLETLKLFKNCNDGTQKYLTHKLSTDPIHKIESQIQYTKQRRKGNKDVANNLGTKLNSDCKEDLLFLRTVLGISHLTYKSLADKLANEIMQCGIDYFERWKDISDPSKESLRLLNYAKSIAVGIQTKDRIKDTIDGIQEWVKMEPIKEDLEFITNKLSSFQNLNNTVSNTKQLILSCRPKLVSIKKKLGFTNDLYISISSAVVNNAQGMLVATVNKAQESANSNTLYPGSGISALKGVIETALDVSYLLQKLDMNIDLKAHYNENHNTLKGLASQLRVSTLSPEDRIEAEIKKLQNKLLNVEGTAFGEKDLKNAFLKMDEIKEWKVFRDQAVRDKQIADQNKLIDRIKQQAKAQKDAEIIELRTQIAKKTGELKEFKL